MMYRGFQHLQRPTGTLEPRKPARYPHLQAWVLGFVMGAFCATMACFMLIDWFTSIGG